MLNLKKIKEIRKKRGKIQADCANILGIVPSEFSRKETGQNEFSVNQLQLLADFLGVDVRVFFDNDDESGAEEETVMSVLDQTKNEVMALQRKQIQLLEQRILELESQISAKKK